MGRGKLPEFPEFKPIELADRNFINGVFRDYQPETSELTFTNIFIWQEHYKIQWSVWKDWLIVSCNMGGDNYFVLPPVGPAPRAEAARMILQWLKHEKAVQDPSIQRADLRLVSELNTSGEFAVEPQRDHFDYVYRTEDLIRLSGNKYHGKKNHINKFKKTYRFSYASLTPDKVRSCLEVADNWCAARRCHEDLDLMDEAKAVKVILENSDALEVKGGVIMINDKVEAFTLGEILNNETAVVHIEKANPEIPQLFVMINQQFCEHAWPGVPFINREQDLGDGGLRRAKSSYHPARMIEKFRIKLTSS
jgi:hypothetical protein